MTPKNLKWLLIVFVALGLAFIFTESTVEQTADDSQVRLFDDIDTQKIAKLSIRKGADEVNVVMKDGRWSVPAREDYPASFGEVRALLLKILGLSVSQRVTEVEDKFEKLGVGEHSAENNSSSVALFDAEGKELTAILLGNRRNSNVGRPAKGSGGQYIRRSDQPQVYLVSQPIDLDVSVKNWLSQTITNVLKPHVVGVGQYSLLDNGESLDFMLTPPGDETEELILKPKLNAGQGLKFPSVNLVRSGLENLLLEDVFGAENEKVSSLKFDRKTEFETDNGLIYRVWSAEQSSAAAQSEASAVQYFVKLEVVFSDELAKRLREDAEAEAQRRREARAKEKEEREKALAESSKEQASGDEESKEAKNDDMSKSEDKASSKDKKLEPEEEIVPDINLASAKDADELNAQFERWVYQLPKHSGSKFRQSHSDFIE